MGRKKIKQIFRFSLTAIIICLLTCAVSSAQVSDTKVVNLSVFIRPATSLQVNPEGGTATVSFNQQDIEKGASARNIQLKVSTNAGKPYKVFFTPSGPLINQLGTALPMETLKLSVSGGKYGKSAIAQPTALALGEHLLYTSDIKGDSDTFMLTIYFDKGKDIIPAGKYNLNFSYRMSSE